MDRKDPAGIGTSKRRQNNAADKHHQRCSHHYSDNSEQRDCRAARVCRPPREVQIGTDGSVAREMPCMASDVTSTGQPGRLFVRQLARLLSRINASSDFNSPQRHAVLLSIWLRLPQLRRLFIFPLVCVVVSCPCIQSKSEDLKREPFDGDLSFVAAT